MGVGLGENRWIRAGRVLVGFGDCEGLLFWWGFWTKVAARFRRESGTGRDDHFLTGHFFLFPHSTRVRKKGGLSKTPLFLGKPRNGLRRGFFFLSLSPVPGLKLPWARCRRMGCFVGGFFSPLYPPKNQPEQKGYFCPTTNPLQLTQPNCAALHHVVYLWFKGTLVCVCA